MNNTYEQIKAILAKKVDVTNLKEDTVLTSIGLDSLDLVETMIDVEEVIGKEFTSDEIKNLKTVKDVMDLIDLKK